MLRRSMLLVVGLAACGGGDDDPVGDVPAECNPLGGVGCVTPWPSSAYLRADADSSTGVRLDFPVGALPTSADDIDVHVAPFNQRTGFSPTTQIFTVFPEGVDDATLVFHDRIEDSVGDASPTVVLDLDTGERVLHFAELDANAEAANELDTQALFIRPAVRLAGGHHYAVGIRRSLKKRGGGELTRPAGFQAILDGAGSKHDRLEAVRAGTLAAVDALETAGIPRDDLLVAWDFVTADDASLLADTGAATNAAIAAIGTDAASIPYEIDVDEPLTDPGMARRVILRFSAPEVAGDQGLHRDGSGAPIVDGASDAKAVLMIPTCATAANKAGILIFGHGFFGNIGEAQGGYMERVARDLCMVVVGGEWRGMSSNDVAVAFGALNDANQVMTFGERIIQGIVDFITLETLARHKLATEVLVDDTAASIVDPSRTYFYGISQGAILGTTLFAWDPYLTRAVAHVGGGDWSLLFERSTNWVTFKLALTGSYPGTLDEVIIEELLQMGLDLTDPANVAPTLLGGNKHMILQMSQGDAQVTNLASEYLARTLGLPLLGPALYEPAGMTETTGPLADAFVQFTEDPMPLPPESNLTNDQGNEAHGQLRKRAAVVEQIGHFFETGEIIHTCGDGPCDCAAGACGPLDPP
jgi:hypothetical protein